MIEPELVEKRAHEIVVSTLHDFDAEYHTWRKHPPSVRYRKRPCVLKYNCLYQPNGPMRTVFCENNTFTGNMTGLELANVIVGAINLRLVGTGYVALVVSKYFFEQSIKLVPADSL